MPRRTQRAADRAQVPLSPSRMPGRPAGVEDDHKVVGMIRAIEAGVPITQACICCGISERAHFRAMRAGERAEVLAAEDAHLTGRQEAYRRYRARVLEARAKVAVVNVALVARAAQGGQVIEETHRRYRDPENGQMVTETHKRFAAGDWRAAKWLLEASFRGEFGYEGFSRVEFTGKDSGPVKVGGEEVLRSIRDRLHAAQRQHALQAEAQSLSVSRGPDDDAAVDVAIAGAGNEMSAS